MTDQPTPPTHEAKAVDTLPETEAEDTKPSNLHRASVLSAVESLGYPCEDKITGFKGILASVHFDLYGCVQTMVTPKVRGDEQKAESKWFDINRLKIDKDAKRVMNLPSFEGAGPDYEHGPASMSEPMPVK